MNFILCVISAMLLLFFASGVSGLCECCLDAKRCQEFTNATNQNVYDLCFSKLPTTQAGKCLWDCVMREYKYMTDEGFQAEKFMQIQRRYFVDYLDVAEEYAYKCKDKKDPKNRCETAFLIWQCMLESAKAKNYYLYMS